MCCKQVYCSFLPVGNERFSTRERPFLFMETLVSPYGNARFRLWERAFPIMELMCTGFS